MFYQKLLLFKWYSQILIIRECFSDTFATFFIFDFKGSYCYNNDKQTWAFYAIYRIYRFFVNINRIYRFFVNINRIYRFFVNINRIYRFFVNINRIYRLFINIYRIYRFFVNINRIYRFNKCSPNRTSSGLQDSKKSQSCSLWSSADALHRSWWFQHIRLRCDRIWGWRAYFEDSATHGRHNHVQWHHLCKSLQEPSSLENKIEFLVIGFFHHSLKLLVFFLTVKRKLCDGQRNKFFFAPVWPRPWILHREPWRAADGRQHLLLFHRIHGIPQRPTEGLLQIQLHNLRRRAEVSYFAGRLAHLWPHSLFLQILNYMMRYALIINRLRDEGLIGIYFSIVPSYFKIEIMTLRTL